MGFCVSTNPIKKFQLINIIFGKSKYFSLNPKKDFSIIFNVEIKYNEIRKGSYLHLFFGYVTTINKIGSQKKMADIIVKTVSMSDSNYHLEIIKISKEKLNEEITSTVMYVK